MPGCCILSCKNRVVKGTQLFHLPNGNKNRGRRKTWIQNIGRSNWNPTTAYLCGDHFTSDQFESNGSEQKKKLRPNAVPTLFTHQSIEDNDVQELSKLCSILSPPFNDDGPSTSRNLETVSKEDLFDESESITVAPSSDSDDEFLAKLKTEPCFEDPIDLFNNGDTKNYERSIEVFLKQNDCLSDEKLDDTSLYGMEIGESRKKSKKQNNALRNGHILVDGTFVPDRASQELEISRLKSSLEKSQNKLNMLEEEVLQLYNEYLGMLNPDQIKFISNKVSNKWSPETVLKSFQLFALCGPEGYKEIKKQNLPYPSIKTLELITDNMGET